MMAPTPRVTVAIVAYKHAEFIRRALDTTLEQEPSQIIICDDASPDRTQNVIRDWIAEHPDTPWPVVTLLHQTNIGLPATLNEALRLTTTPYFVYLAGDDWHLPGRLTRQADFMEKTRAGLSFGHAERADREGRIFERSFYERHPQWFAQTDHSDSFATLLMEGNFIPAPSVMFSTEALRLVGGFDPLIAWEDHDSYTRIASRYPIAFLDGDPLAVHRELDDSLGVSLIRHDSLPWVEGQARFLLKHLGARAAFDRDVAERAFALTARAARLGADPAWVHASLSRIGPYLRSRKGPGWYKWRVKAAWRALISPDQ